MGLTAFFVGAFSGTGMHMMSNAIQKVPLSRSKWVSVGYFLFSRFNPDVVSLCFRTVDARRLLLPRGVCWAAMGPFGKGISNRH